MILEPEQETRSNKIFKVIKEFERMFPEELRKCDINQCGHCSGTGYNDKHQLDFCDWCGGMGYKGFKKIQGEFVCRTCNGCGCRRCDNNGIVDWVTHANGRDIIRGEKYI
jgi:DnaJ-class molecular chaperone